MVKLRVLMPTIMLWCINIYTADWLEQAIKTAGAFCPEYHGEENAKRIVNEQFQTNCFVAGKKQVMLAEKGQESDNRIAELVKRGSIKVLTHNTLILEDKKKLIPTATFLYHNNPESERNALLLQKHFLGSQLGFYSGQAGYLIGILLGYPPEDIKYYNQRIAYRNDRNEVIQTKDFKFFTAQVKKIQTWAGEHKALWERPFNQDVLMYETWIKDNQQFTNQQLRTINQELARTIDILYGVQPSVALIASAKDDAHVSSIIEEPKQEEFLSVPTQASWWQRARTMGIGAALAASATALYYTYFKRSTPQSLQVP